MGVTSRLNVFRTGRGWTQAQLAEHAGVSRQTINSIETGRFEPSLSLALKLARLFDVPVESLFGLAEAAGTTESSVPLYGRAVTE